MTERPDHELEVLEDDQSVPPRPEEDVADAARTDAGGVVETEGPVASDVPDTP